MKVVRILNLFGISALSSRLDAEINHLSMQRIARSVRHAKQPLRPAGKPSKGSLIQRTGFSPTMVQRRNNGALLP